MLLLLTTSAFADDLADFNAAIGAVGTQNRAAIGALQSGNNELAELELDRLRTAWRQVSERKRPTAFKDSELYTTVMTDIATRLVSADMMIKFGRPDVARTALLGIRDNLYDLRKSAGIVVLADCVRDANGAMDALAAYEGRAADALKSDTADLTGKAKGYGDTLTRCDHIAGPVKDDPAFRQLIDDAKANIALISQAVTARDAGLLRRALNELRSLDALLALRFG
ncbi:hypothetical protein MXD81_33065 [Microbacteriaceae bacterium K1510]|nr:hypothetical protein [Microbacteriaceae bacterium K1510]